MVFSGLHARFIPTPVGNTTGSADARSGGRFIPTPVGNTTATNPRLVQVPVHPHACGEHFALPKQLKPSHGSSPRLWGTLSLNRPEGCPVRFIPTPVGNTSKVSRSSLSSSVHPHACGEHLILLALGICGHGSSPRLWGTLLTRDHPTIQQRFIPTPVGNTPDQRLIESFGAVHPHACGEHGR